jgi:hypothetical protein
MFFIVAEKSFPSLNDVHPTQQLAFANLEDEAQNWVQAFISLIEE